MLTVGSNLMAIAEDSASNFIPSLKVTYKTSKAFEERKAEIGDFTADDISLGKTVEVVAITYKLKSVAVKENDYKGFYAAIDDGTPFRDKPAYKKFVADYADCVIEDGVEVLLYIPERHKYVAFLAKKKLLEGALKIINMSNGEKIVKVTSIVKEWNKKSWVVLDVAPTDKEFNQPEGDNPALIRFTQQVDDNAAPAADAAENGRER